MPCGRELSVCPNFHYQHISVLRFDLGAPVRKISQFLTSTVATQHSHTLATSLFVPGDLGGAIKTLPTD